MRRSATPIIALLIILAGLLSVSLVVLFDQVEHLALVFLIPLMALLGAVPIGFRIARGNFDLFEITVPYAFAYFLFYGAGALFVLFVHGAASDNTVKDYIDPAVGYCTLGLACAMLGYHLTGRFVRPNVQAPGPRMGWMAVAALFSLGFLGSLIAAQFESRLMLVSNILVSGLTSFCQQLTFLTNFCLFYVLYLLLSRTATPGHKLLLFGWMIPATLISVFLRVGNKTALILALGLPFIAFWYARRRVPWKSLTVLFVVVVFGVFPFYWIFRTVKGGGYTREYRMERSFTELGKQRAGEFASGALQTVAKRLALVNSTAAVVRDCGNTVDYQYGRTLWLGIQTVAIPRFIWPDKPTTNIGQEFGRTFHITGFSDYSFISTTMVGELYWNFHLPGVILGMLLMGVCMRSIYLRFGVNGGANPFRLSIYVVLLIATITECEGGISGWEGAVIKQAIILLALERLFYVVQGVADRRLGRQTKGAALALVR